MQLADIVAHHEHPSYPAVSLLAGVPGDAPASVLATLRSQLTEVRERLELEFSGSEVQDVLSDLERTIARVEIDPRARSVAVYASPRETSWVALPVELRERVVVDDTFATRDVVHALLRARRYRVLVLGARSRLFSGTGGVLRPVTTGGFPVVVEEPSKRDAPRRRERADLDRRRLRLATRALDDALDAPLRHDPLPLFVIGLQPRLGWFERHSRHRKAVSATALGGPHTLTEIQSAVQPLADELFDRAAREALVQVDRARSARRLATGIVEAWQLANQGRGSVLVVEEGYEYPALLGEDPTDVRPAADAKAPGVVDDLVDEMIELVLARGGRVVIVPDGSLADHGRVALTLHY
jgi:hypothetical protein